MLKYLLGAALLTGCAPAPTAGEAPRPARAVPAERPAASGTGDETVPVRADTVYLPRFNADPDRAYPEAALGGLLLLDGPCLRVRVGRSAPALVVWPPGTTLSRSPDGPVRVVRADGVTVTVGEIVRFGGGLSGPDAVPPPPAHLDRGVPAECPPPFLVAGSFEPSA